MPNQEYRFSNSAFRIIGYVTMGILLVFSVVFYRERAWLLDIAYQTFLMINEGTVQVMVYRFGSAIVQLLPLIGIKLGAPLWLISMLYSVSFTLIFLLIYFLIIWVCRNDYFGLVLVFTFTLLVFDSFYWTTSEQIQGLAGLLLFYSYWVKYVGKQTIVHGVITLVGVIALAYYHPLIFISFYFLWLFMLLHNTKQFWNLQHALLAAWMAVVLMIKKYWSANWYDDVKYNNFYQNLELYGTRLWEIPSHNQFLLALLEVWYWFPILLVGVTVLYCIQRNWLKLGLVWCFCISYILLLHIGDTEMSYRFYAEVNYLVLTIFTGVPLVFDGIGKWEKNAWVIVLVGTVLLSRMMIIGFNHRPFSQRISWIQEQLDNPDDSYSQKLLIHKNKVSEDTLLMFWGMPFESLIISSAKEKSNGRTIYIPNSQSKFEKAMILDTLFYSDFKAWPNEYLNPKYFSIHKGTYQEIQ